MQKKGSTAMVISIILVIASMVIGIFLGMFIGKVDFPEKAKASDAALETPQTQLQIETQSKTEAMPESEIEPESAVEASATVMVIGDRSVPMNEVNVRLYTLRSYYIQMYGEEPWSEILDDGRTVAEAAKAELENDMIRAEVYMNKAADYGIVVTDEIRRMCEEEAKVFMQDLGPDVSQEFGLSQEAVTNVYIKYQVITAVTNAVNDEIRGEILADTANAGMSDSDLDVRITEMLQQKEAEWRASYTISFSDIWQNIVVGSVG